MKQLLQEARHEILALRRRNDILSAKVETMELMASVNRPLPTPQPNTMAVDVAWQLQNAVAELEQAERELPQANR